MTYTISQLMRSIQGLPVEAPGAAASGGDAEVLARELSRAFMEQLRKFRDARDADTSLVDSGEFGLDKTLERIRAKSPDSVSFQEIEWLSRDHPDEALARWEQVKAAAGQDLANGWDAARDVSTDAWGRARFLAIRDQLQQLWPPRNGVEAMLLDEMAQYELLRRDTVKSLRHSPWVGDSKRGTANAATVEMGRSVERLQRLLHYALRTLLALRRTQRPAAVQRAIAGAMTNDE